MAGIKGDSVKKSSTALNKPNNIKLSESDQNMLDQLAKENGTNRTAFIREAIQEKITRTLVADEMHSIINAQLYRIEEAARAHIMTQEVISRLEALEKKVVTKEDLIQLKGEVNTQITNIKSNFDIGFKAQRDSFETLISRIRGALSTNKNEILNDYGVHRDGVLTYLNDIDLQLKSVIKDTSGINELHKILNESGAFSENKTQSERGN